MAQDKTANLKRAQIEALTKSLGIVTDACNESGISRDTHYRWMQEDPEYRAAVESLADVSLDFAESKLYKLIKEGNPAATIFYLKTRGKKRGYIERQEITGADGVDIWPTEIKIQYVPSGAPAPLREEPTEG